MDGRVKGQDYGQLDLFGVKLSEGLALPHTDVYL